MKRFCGFLFAVFILTVSMWAQTKNPVTTVVKEILPRQQKNLVAAVEEMPADKFSFKPTPAQMSFGHLVAHIVESNNYLCAKIGDTTPPKGAELKETDSKEKLLAGLKASFDFCGSLLSKADDSTLGDTIQAYGGHDAPRAWAYIALTNDWADHYSAAATYLRLNGLLPPTAKK
jgi:hypothetical protein